jgi:type VI protein secretion system component Hcp
MILYSCKDSVNNPGGSGTTETLILSVDSVYFTDQSANMFSIDTTFQNCSLKKFRLSFTAFTNDDDTTNSYLGYTFLDSSLTTIHQYLAKGHKIDSNINNSINLNYEAPNRIWFHFSMGFTHFNNPPIKWILLKKFKLYIIN